MIVLGIETSCDDTSVCLLKSSQKEVEVLSHLRFGQEEIFKLWGGVVPEIAARNHLEKITPLLKSCFEEARLKIEDIDLIGVTTYPGLLGPLLTGLNSAKTISLLTQKPLLAVNHLFAHLEAIHLTQDISYPYIGVLVSGGHSAFFLVEDRKTFKTIGHTIDDAAGEAFDKGGKILGLGYPAGHIIDRLASFGDEKKYTFPIGLKHSGDTKMSFSGLKTSLRVFMNDHADIKVPTQFETKDEKFQNFYDVCASYQFAIVDSLRFKLAKAFKLNDIKDLPIVVGGGVACNTRLRSLFQEKLKHVHFVEPKFCTDNGAMIANFALRNHEDALSFPECLKTDARSRFLSKDPNVP